MALRYVLCVGTKYYGIHVSTPAPEFVAGQLIRAGCEIIDDYQAGGWLKTNKFLVQTVRPLTPQETQGLCLQAVDTADYRVVILRRSTSKRIPVLAWPTLRLVYFWQWKRPRGR